MVKRPNAVARRVQYIAPQDVKRKPDDEVEVMAADGGDISRTEALDELSRLLRPTKKDWYVGELVGKVDWPRRLGTTIKDRALVKPPKDGFRIEQAGKPRTNGRPGRRRAIIDYEQRWFDIIECHQVTNAGRFPRRKIVPTAHYTKADRLHEWTGRYARIHEVRPFPQRSAHT